MPRAARLSASAAALAAGLLALGAAPAAAAPAALGTAAVREAPLTGSTPVPGTEPFTRTTPPPVSVSDGSDPANPRTFLLAYDLYVPDGASATDPRPAIVMTNGFGLSKDADEVRAMSSYLARHGYVVLAYTAAGFGTSGGCISLQSVDFDAKSTKQLIDKVLDVRTDVLHDAKGAVVGTVGGSYGGGGQLVLAGIDPRVRAAAPGRTWNLLRYSLNPNNRVVPGDPTGFSHELNDQGVFKAQWSSLFFLSGNAQPLGGIPPSGTPKGGCLRDPYAGSTTTPTVPALTPPFVAPPVPYRCIGFIGPVCETFARVFGTGDTTAADRTLLDRASADTFLDPARAAAAGGSPVRIPVLLVQGQRDTLFNVNDALATYTDLQRAGVPVEMIWNWGGHGGYDSLPGECEVYGGGIGSGAPDYTGLEDCYLTSRTLSFFDRYLRGRPGTAPGFAWQRDWVAYAGSGSAAGQYGTATRYPAMPSTTWTLSGTNALVPSGTTATSAGVTLVNPLGGLPPSYSETSNFSGPKSTPQIPLPPTDQPQQTASFTTPPFSAAVESVGVPRATLKLAHTAPSDLVLFAKVYDVAPDGTSILIHRQVAPVRVPSAALAQPVDLALVGFAYRFDAGHSARLVVTTTDAAYRNNPLLDVVTLTTGAGSTFSLPMSTTTATPAPTEPTSTPSTQPALLPTTSARSLAATGVPAVLPVVALGLLGAAALASRRRRRG